MKNRNLLLLITPLFFSISTLNANTIQRPSTEIIEKKNVAKIEIIIESSTRQTKSNSNSVQSQLTTKVGDPFSQKSFDFDLKKLSEQFDRVDPYVQIREGQVYITLRLHEKPYIRSITWNGNTQIKTKTLQKELGIEPQTVFTKDEFVKAFNKVKDYYVKHGYFEAILSYTLEPIPNTNEIIIHASVNEGRSAHIHKIKFKGISDKEESSLLDMINTKRYNLFTSWLTGSGIYRPESIEHDRITIVNFFQNEGYADAQVEISLEETKTRQLIIAVYVQKGPQYKIGNINISGTSLKTKDEIHAILGVKEGDTYSPDNLRRATQNIKDFYGKEGRIDSNAEYELQLSESAPLYDVDFYIKESNQFKIGIIRVLGNTSTNTNVILNQSNLVPGEIFNSIKLQQTQMRLESTGLFKSVNVYAIRNSDDDSLGSDYRDINIEVEETSTGNVSLFFGLSSSDSLYGGLDISENNFNHKGLLSFWKNGLSSLRGGGEYAHAKFSVGAKEQVYSLSWMNPYFDDSLWRLGYDVTYATSRVTNDDFHSKSIGLNVFSSYPLSANWTVGWKSRVQNSIIKVGAELGAAAQRQTRNSGIVLGTAGFLAYDSTDNILKPHSGIRSNFEIDLAGVRRHDNVTEDFLFSKLLYTNSYYYPIWSKGTFKARADAKFLSTFGAGKPILLPANERFYLGGESTVRGYRPAIIGPRYPIIDPTDDQKEDPCGGASSVLLSAEYSQNIFRMLDLFIFFDAGAVSLKEFNVNTFRSSYGAGARIDIGNRLPLMVGYGIPINPLYKEDVQHFFFSMGGQF